MECWKSPLLHGSCSHLLHCCPSFHERNPQYYCCQAVDPSVSLSYAPALLFGLI